jgi:hypothetical protein
VGIGACSNAGIARRRLGQPAPPASLRRAACPRVHIHASRVTNERTLCAHQDVRTPGCAAVSVQVRTRTPLRRVSPSRSCRNRHRACTFEKPRGPRSKRSEGLVSFVRRWSLSRYRIPACLSGGSRASPRLLRQPGSPCFGTMTTTSLGRREAARTRRDHHQRHCATSHGGGLRPRAGRAGQPPVRRLRWRAWLCRRRTGSVSA